MINKTHLQAFISIISVIHKAWLTYLELKRLYFSSTLTQTISALSSLLYPFRWQHVFIPVLPEEMLEVCCSPTPYLIGILSSHVQRVQTLPLSEVSIVVHTLILSPASPLSASRVSPQNRDEQFPTVASWLEALKNRRGLESL